MRCRFPFITLVLMTHFDDTLKRQLLHMMLPFKIKVKSVKCAFHVGAAHRPGVQKFCPEAAPVVGRRNFR